MEVLYSCNYHVIYSKNVNERVCKIKFMGCQWRIRTRRAITYLLSSWSLWYVKQKNMQLYAGISIVLYFTMDVGQGLFSTAALPSSSFHLYVWSSGAMKLIIFHYSSFKANQHLNGTFSFLLFVFFFFFSALKFSCLNPATFIISLWSRAQYFNNHLKSNVEFFWFWFRWASTQICGKSYTANPASLLWSTTSLSQHPINSLNDCIAHVVSQLPSSHCHGIQHKIRSDCWGNYLPSECTLKG